MILLQNPSRIVAQDFDIDTRTGFVPPIVPISRLPNQWEPWERVLDNLQSNRLSLGDKKNLSTEDAARSEAWRARVREVLCHNIGLPLNIILMLLFWSCPFCLSRICRDRTCCFEEDIKC